MKYQCTFLIFHDTTVIALQNKSLVANNGDSLTRVQSKGRSRGVKGLIYVAASLCELDCDEAHLHRKGQFDA